MGSFNDNNILLCYSLQLSNIDGTYLTAKKLQLKFLGHHNDSAK